MYFNWRGFLKDSLHSLFPAGHPLADQIPLECDQRAARLALELPEAGRVLALLPGSRGSEVEQLAPDFLATARWLHERDPTLQFVIPAANAERAQQLEELVAHKKELNKLKFDSKDILISNKKRRLY